MFEIPADPIEIYANSPKELVIIEVEVDDAVVATGYQVCIYPSDARPADTDPGWQTPETAGNDTGIFIGSQSNRGAFTKGQYLRAWYYLDDDPEKIIHPAKPLVHTI